MGGKNPTIVTANADIDKAVDGVARSAFGFSGQKCSACSRVYVERPVYDEFMSKLTDRDEDAQGGRSGGARCLRRPGDRRQGRRAVRSGPCPRRRAERSGPVDAADRGRVRARAASSSRRWSMGLPASHELFKREIFLPFVVVAPVDSLDEAISLANDTEYGLTAGVFTEDEGEIDQFFNGIEAGVVYANRRGGATTGAWPGCQSFCGWKASGSTGKGGLGPYYVQQFLREQSRTRVVE